MYTIISSLCLLVIGYFVYGIFIEKILKIDPKNITPAYCKTDGVDYVPLPTWKVFLIQFLNIAGLGPIFGAIMGILYGPAAFLWIVLGTIFAGGVHDFCSGIISIRKGGVSLPEIIGDELGTTVKHVMRVFALLLMILVGAVFVVNPAELLNQMTGDSTTLQMWIGIILLYYVCATILPIDKLIGNLYPVFGFALLFMAVGILVALFFNAHHIPEITDGIRNMQSDPDKYPIFPMMFISIACGAISGFHATQTPMMARCLKNEKYARPIFYGAMVAEGIVAIIWAAAAIAFTGSYENLATYFVENGYHPSILVNDISQEWLGVFGGFLVMLGVIAAPITSGDTALRCARLIAADFLKVNQSKMYKRLLISLPIFVLTFFIMQIDFSILWRYFAWSNQTLAAITLWAITTYLARDKKPYIISLIPALFMTMVTVTYIMFAPEGFQLNYYYSIGIAIAVTTILLAIFVRFLRNQRANTIKEAL